MEICKNMHPDPQFFVQGSGETPFYRATLLFHSVQIFLDINRQELTTSMALLAGKMDNEIVWDPFCGSGIELTECAMRGGARGHVRVRLPDGDVCQNLKAGCWRPDPWFPCAGEVIGCFSHGKIF
jgi:hypothetical protein